MICSRLSCGVLLRVVGPLCLWTGGLGAAPPPGGEVRAIWVTRWDYRTEEDVRTIIQNCASLGINRVMLQVRGQADAFYRSSLEPWGEGLEGAPERDGDPGFDPLSVAIAESRRHRLEIHAWVNVLPAWKGSRPPRSKKHLVHTHPDWFLTDQAGRRRMLERDRYGMLNPCLPPVREHLKAVVGEIAGRYPVAGVQIDYIRFLDRAPGNGEDVPFDSTTLALFRSVSRSTPKENPQAWDLFRRQAIDQLVAEMAGEVRRRRPGCSFSAAAMRDADHARGHLFQDASSWVERRWVDEVYLMNYEREAGRFADQALSWVQSCGPQAVVVGVGVHLLDGAPSLREQLRLLRDPPQAERAAGYSLFSYPEFFPSRSPESRSDPQSQARRVAMRKLLRSLNPLVLRADPRAEVRAEVLVDPGADGAER